MSYGESTAGFAPASILTRAELLDHAKHPRNRGALLDAEVIQEEVNPLCGDVVTMYAKLDSARGTLHAARHTGSGCLISQAAASMLSEVVLGKSVAAIAAMERTDMEALIGGVVSPSRVKCVMLPLVALQNGLKSFSSGRAARANPSEISASLHSAP